MPPKVCYHFVKFDVSHSSIFCDLQSSFCIFLLVYFFIWWHGFMVSSWESLSVKLWISVNLWSEFMKKCRLKGIYCRSWYRGNCNFLYGILVGLFRHNGIYLFGECCCRHSFQPGDCIILCRLVRPPSSCISGHESTMWPMVCRWPQSQN